MQLAGGTYHSRVKKFLSSSFIFVCVIVSGLPHEVAEGERGFRWRFGCTQARRCPSTLSQWQAEAPTLVLCWQACCLWPPRELVEGERGFRWHFGYARARRYPLAISW